jgi:hypothetical protein
MQFRTTWNYSAVAILHTFHVTVSHALGFSHFTSRLWATNLLQSHCNFKSHMKSWRHLQNLIQFSSDYCSILPATLVLLLLSCRTLLITTLLGPHRKHRLLLSRMCVYCSIIEKLPSIIEHLCFWNVFTNPLPSSEYTYHNMATMAYVNRLDYAVFSVVKCIHYETLLLYYYLFVYVF